MGFFSTNEHSSLYRSYEFPVVEGYSGTVGCGLALIEGYQNDLALFAAAVSSDLNESAILQEGASDYELMALQEASISGMIDAIKKFFIKLGAKIKAIFTAFMAKLESYFVKDLKAYVKKYERSLDKKDYKDLKVKIMPLKKDTYVDEKVYSGDTYDIKFATDYDRTDLRKQVEDVYENYERSDYIEEIYKNLIDNSISTHADFDEWYHDRLFDTTETVDDWDYTKIKRVAMRLTENTKTLSNIKRFYDKVQGDIKKVLKKLDERDKVLSKEYKNSKDGKASKNAGYNFSIDVDRAADNMKGPGTVTMKVDKDNKKTELDILTKQLSITRMDASAYQDIVLHISQTVMKEAKVAIAQDKKVFAAAVAYKATTTESTLLDMIAECAYDETIEQLDRIA